MSTNEYAVRARAAKVHKLVQGATLCNDLMVHGSAEWPANYADGLRHLANMLGWACSDKLWAMIAVPYSVTTEASAETRALVIAALHRRADEYDNPPTEAETFAGLTSAGF